VITPGGKRAGAQELLQNPPLFPQIAGDRADLADMSA